MLMNTQYGPIPRTVAEENLKKFKRKVPKTPVLLMAAAFDEGLEKFKKTIRKTAQGAAAEQARETDS